MIYCFLILLLFRPCESQDLKGFQFEDNFLEARFGPENGYAIYDTGNYVDKFISLFFN